MYHDQKSLYLKVQKLFKGGNYSRAETICGNTVDIILISNFIIVTLFVNVPVVSKHTKQQFIRVKNVGPQMTTKKRTWEPEPPLRCRHIDTQGLRLPFVFCCFVLQHGWSIAIHRSLQEESWELTVAIYELLCLKNTGTQLATLIFFISNK